MLDNEAQTETLLDVNNIEVIYNHVILVLKGVSLQVPKGGITALLGGNGAGKNRTGSKGSDRYLPVPVGTLCYARETDELIGDFNGDCIVDGEDFGFLLTQWGAVDSPANLDGVGSVDGSDVGLFFSNFGSTCP